VAGGVGFAGGVVGGTAAGGGLGRGLVGSSGCLGTGVGVW